MARLFVAVPVPDGARDHVLDALAGVRDDERLAWTRPDGWHATLAFVGEVGDVDGVVAVTRAAVAARGARPFTVRTGEAVTLARGSALALRLDDRPDGTMADLGDAVQETLVDAGFHVDRRRVRPHLTLGRARGRRPVPREVLAAVDVPPVTWGVEHVEVLESVLGGGPASYRTVARAPLGDAGA